MNSKKLFKCNKCGAIHFGLNKPFVCLDCNTPNAYENATKKDADSLLRNLGKRKLWRCFVCNDLQIGINPPTMCPTCGQLDSYAEINEKEIRILLEI